MLNAKKFRSLRNTGVTTKHKNCARKYISMPYQSDTLNVELFLLYHIQYDTSFSVIESIYYAKNFHQSVLNLKNPFPEQA